MLATWAAVEEGIVSGGGMVLMRAQQVLKDDLGLAGDELTGLRIVERGTGGADQADLRERRQGGFTDTSACPRDEARRRLRRFERPLRRSSRRPQRRGAEARRQCPRCKLGSNGGQDV